MRCFHSLRTTRKPTGYLGAVFAAALLTFGVVASPVAAQVELIDLITVDEVSPFATPDGRVGFGVSFQGDWPPPDDLFSIFFAVEVSSPDAFPFSGGWQRHDGVPESFGTTEQGEFTPDVFITADHNVLVISPIRESELDMMPGLFFGVQSAVMDTPDGTRLEGPGGGGSLPDGPGILPVRDPLVDAVFNLTTNTVMEPPTIEPADAPADDVLADDPPGGDLVEPNDDELALSDEVTQAALDEVNTQEFASDGSSPAAMIAIAIVVIALLLLAVVMMRRKKANLLSGALGSGSDDDGPLSGILGGMGGVGAADSDPD